MAGLDGTFSDIHEKYAESILKKIEFYENDPEQDMPPAFMKEVREFLKDNKIDLDANKHKKSPVKNIAETLPFKVVD